MINFDEIEGMHNQMDQLFKALFRETPLLGHGQGRYIPRARLPLCDVREGETSVLCAIELPGIDKKDIDLSISNDHIEVKVEQIVEKQDKQEQAIMHSSKSLKFYRAIPLPVTVNAEQATATYKDGVLRIEMPKIVPARKKIEIQ